MDLLGPCLWRFGRHHHGLFFGDSQDAFRVVDGELQRGFVSVTSSKDETDPTDPDIIKRMQAAWTYGKIEPDEDFFGEPAFNRIVTHYASKFEVRMSV